MKQPVKDLGLPLLMILLVSLGAVIALPITPIDETRYVSAAWEMWQKHSFLVPYLNGEIYSHKPPFLFWMIHAGWVLFGVQDFVPRLIPGIFSLLNLMLVYRVGLRLWPEERKNVSIAVLILASTVIWDVWSVAIMFDMVLTFWILLGLLGTLRAADQQRGGWLLLAAGVGGGLVTKGPAVLVYLLSVPLLRAWWDVKCEKPIRATWYLCILGATALGFAIALLWVVPAVVQGGPTYREAILWKQTAGRIASSFDHKRPFWWYLPILPAFFFPWILFRPSFAKINLKTSDRGTRFCLTWMALPLLIFSMISGKQVHYLIPFIPAGALLIGRNIAHAKETLGRKSIKVIGWLFILLGLVILIIPFINLGGDVGQMEHGDTLFITLGFLISGLFLLLPICPTCNRYKRIAVCMVIILLCALVEDKKNFMDDYDIKAAASAVKQQMDEGHPIAHIGKYHGQYQFLGRLEKPVAVLRNKPEEILEFAKNNPGTVFISYLRENDQLPDNSTPCFSQEYRGKTVVLWQFSNQP